MAYELADGTVREISFGFVGSEFMGATTAGRVVFAAPRTEALFRLTALESVRIVVDPANRRVKAAGSNSSQVPRALLTGCACRRNRERVDCYEDRR
jgi:hypothetical protein